MKNDDVKKLISSVRDQTNQLKRVVNENLNTSSRQQPDRSPTLKSSKSNNSLLKKELSDSKQDNSFTTNTPGKTNKTKLADLLGYKKDTHFTSVVSDEPRRTTLNRITDNNMAQGEEEGEDNLYFQNKKGQGSKANLSAMEADKKGYSQAYDQQKNAKTNRNYNDTSQINLNLEKENEALRGTVADYKRAFDYLLKKHKELQKTIDKLSVKEDEVKELSKALQLERHRNKVLRNQNVIIKDKFVKFVENVRENTTEDKDGDHEEDVFYHSIVTQNEKLREIIYLSKLPDSSVEKQLLQNEEMLRSEDQAHGTNSIGKWRPHLQLIDTGSVHRDSKQEYQETKDLIEDYKKDKLKKLSSKKSLSTESDQGSVVSNDESFESSPGNDNTPILQNRHSHMSNSSETSTTSEGGSRINFVSRQTPSIFGIQAGAATTTTAGNSLNNLFKTSA